MKYAAVALAVVLAAFLRFYQLDSIPPGLHADEATDGNDARAAWRTGQFHVFYPENNGREGLAINLQAVALGLAGVARPWVVRWPSAVFGTLTVNSPVSRMSSSVRRVRRSPIAMVAGVEDTMLIQATARVSACFIVPPTTSTHGMG